MTESLLGPFIQRVPDVAEMRDWLFRVRPNVVLTMSNSTAQAILGNRPRDWNPIVIGRKYFGSQPLENARGVARSIVDGQWDELCQEGTVTHMMLYNEISPHNGRWERYIDWEQEALDELTHFGIKYVAGSWSVGCPDELYYRCMNCGWNNPNPPAGVLCPNCSSVVGKRIVYWDDPRVHVLMREVAQAGGLLNLHQYNAPSVADTRDFDPLPEDIWIWDPTISTSWRVLRHRKARLQLLDFLSPEDISDFVIGECGVECGAVNWPIYDITPGELAGWQTTQNAEEYMEGLQWLDWQCRHDPYVKGLVVFLMGTYTGTGEPWVTHDVWDVREAFGVAILNPLPIESPPPSPPPPTELEAWIEGMVATGAVDELPFVPENYIEALGLRMGWVPTSDEWMLVPPERFGLRHVFVKVFVAPALAGGYDKKIVWWVHGDWENYKIITTDL